MRDVIYIHKNKQHGHTLCINAVTLVLNLSRTFVTQLITYQHIDPQSQLFAHYIVGIESDVESSQTQKQLIFHSPNVIDTFYHMFQLSIMCDCIGVCITLTNVHT